MFHLVEFASHDIYLNFYYIIKLFDIWYTCILLKVLNVQYIVDHPFYTYIITT